MDVSPKNTLQEYYQKKSLPLPAYKTKRAGGQDHTSVWISNVTLENKLVFEGVGCGSKKDAELSAASFALEYLDGLKREKLLRKNAKISAQPQKYNDSKSKTIPVDSYYVEPSHSHSSSEDQVEFYRKETPKNSTNENFVLPSKNFGRIVTQTWNEPKKLRQVEARGFVHPGQNDNYREVSNYSPNNNYTREQLSIPSKNNNYREVSNYSQNNNDEYLFIDVENQSVIAKNVIQLLRDKKIKPNVIITFVMSECLRERFKFQEDVASLNNPNVSYYCIIGDAGYLKNSADMVITILAARVDPTYDVIILTADKFAHLVSMVGNFVDKRKRIFHITNERDLLERICI